MILQLILSIFIHSYIYLNPSLRSLLLVRSILLSAPPKTHPEFWLRRRCAEYRGLHTWLLQRSLSRTEILQYQMKESTKGSNPNRDWKINQNHESRERTVASQEQRLRQSLITYHIVRIRQPFHFPVLFCHGACWVAHLWFVRLWVELDGWWCHVFWTRKTAGLLIWSLFWPR